MSEKENGEQLFLVSFTLYQVLCMWETTMFPMPFSVELIGKAAALGLVAVKILIYDGYRPIQLAGFAAAGICTAVGALISGYLPPFVWAVYLAGSRKVSFRKILLIYLVVTGAGLLTAYAASMLGVIENLQYVSASRGIRNSFGIIYATDFSAHIFYLLLIGFYLLGERLRVWHYLGACLAAALVYHFCGARLDSACILIMALLFFAGNAVERSGTAGTRVRRLWRRCWVKAGPFIMPACMAAAVGLTCAYGAAGEPSSGILNELNELSSYRLYLGWEAIRKYGIHFLGRNIPMKGFGGTTKVVSWSSYTFVDSSYVNLLLQAGVFCMGALIICYAVSCHRNRRDLYFLYAVALVSVNSIVAHHLIETAYNPLLLAVFTECIRGSEGRKDLNISDNRSCIAEFAHEFERGKGTILAGDTVESCSGNMSRPSSQRMMSAGNTVKSHAGRMARWLSSRRDKDSFEA